VLLSLTSKDQTFVLPFYFNFNLGWLEQKKLKLRACVLWVCCRGFENKIMEMRKRRSGGGSEVGNSEKKIKPRTSEERERKRKR